MKLVTRYSRNPILTKKDVPYPVVTVHNAAVAEENGIVRLYWGAYMVMCTGTARTDDLVQFCLTKTRKAARN